MHPIMDLAVPAGRLAVHWFGQNSYAVKTPGGQVILVDPYFPHDRPAEKFVRPEPPVDERDLRVEVVVFTHDHRDHTNDETIARLVDSSPEMRGVGPVESVKRAREAGMPADHLVTVKAGDEQTFGDATLHFVYSKPPQGDPTAGIKAPDVAHLGVVLVCGDVRLYWSGDTINTFGLLDDLVEPVRKLQPQIGFITTHPTEGEFVYFDGAALMARRIGLQAAYPSHYDCFAKRTFNPGLFAVHFTAPGPQPRIMGYNQTVLLP